MNEIERFYDEEYEEWERLAWHLPEFEVTRRYMQQYLATPQKVLDIGGGPGRYSIFLAQQGHEVTLLDLSGKNIRQAIEKAKEAGVHLDSCIHGNALWLSEYFYKEEQYDAVLLMGPLYHLLQEEDRKKALAEALRVLKPGGLMIASFISNYAPLQDYASRLKDLEDGERLLRYLEDGRNEKEDAVEFTTSYFCSAREARDFMAEAGLTQLVFAGVENILSGKEEQLHRLSEEQREKWLDLAWRLSPDQNLLGMSQHFLYIGRK
ncbi:MAG: class I SAM-dependent methyltransferase [Clostridiales bacterium]|mgnify:FL=1|nr:MAG: class I SAM-dependent methyltransferase [Clostridiales bacterium]HJA31469.1 class I SAM-dependent methyltransferase [Candidatus Eisenbergiella pullicola]